MGEIEAIERRREAIEVAQDTVPARADELRNGVAQYAGFSLHAGIGVEADQRVSLSSFSLGHRRQRRARADGARSCDYARAGAARAEFGTDRGDAEERGRSASLRITILRPCSRGLGNWQNPPNLTLGALQVRNGPTD